MRDTNEDLSKLKLRIEALEKEIGDIKELMRACPEIASEFTQRKITGVPLKKYSTDNPLGD